MKFTEQEIRALSASNDENGWAAIPAGTPQRFVQSICEFRAQKIGFTPAKPTNSNDAAGDAARRARALKQLAACLQDSGK